MSDTGFALRPMVTADEPFVYRAWLEGSWPHFAGNLVMPKSAYMVSWHRVIERILDCSPCIVAHVDGAASSLLGFSVEGEYNSEHGSNVLHWCYVKQAFRGLGIARALTGGMRQCSHWSDKLPRDWAYVPQALKGFGA